MRDFHLCDLSPLDHVDIVERIPVHYLCYVVVLLYVLVSEVDFFFLIFFLPNSVHWHFSYELVN